MGQTDLREWTALSTPCPVSREQTQAKLDLRAAAASRHKASQTYCTAKTNSLGCLPSIGTNGVQPDKSAGNFTVTCTNVLNQKNGLLYWSFSPSATPFQGGIKCVNSPSVRTSASSSGGAASGNSCTGSYAFNFSTAYMNAHGLVPGHTLYAQWWMRDPASSFSTGLSNGLQFTVCD